MSLLTQKTISGTISLNGIGIHTGSKVNLKINNRKYTSEDAELLLIGDGSKLFENNTFYLNDKFGLKSINIYNETDVQICKCGLKNHFANYETPKIINKKPGIFEKFFNFFDK